MIEIQAYSASHQIPGAWVWLDKGLKGETLTGPAIPNGPVRLTLQQAAQAEAFVKLNWKVHQNFWRECGAEGKCV